MTEIPRKITPFAARPRTRGEKLAGRKRGLGGQADAWAALTAEEDAAGQSRLMAAASQLHDRAADTRVLGVQALVQLADESDVFRQQCIDLLCAAVRERPGVFPEGPPEPDDARLRAYRDDRALRRAIISAITTRLRPDARVSWRGCDLDFTGTIFDEDPPATIEDERSAAPQEGHSPASPLVRAVQRALATIPTPTSTPQPSTPQPKTPQPRTGSRRRRP